MRINGLVFSSRVDNYPLILCEALWIGVPVIATHSDAAREVLQKSGGKTVSEEEVLQLVQLSKPEMAQAIFGTTLAEFSQARAQPPAWTTDAGGVCQLLSESVATCCCR